MNWAEIPKKKTVENKSKVKENHETASILMDTLTCAFVYLESVKRYQSAVEAIPDAEDENYAKARALAWERACSTSIDMLNKAFQELNTDTRIGEILASRWEQADNVIVASIAVIALMNEEDKEAGNE